MSEQGSQTPAVTEILPETDDYVKVTRPKVQLSFLCDTLTKIHKEATARATAKAESAAGVRPTPPPPEQKPTPTPTPTVAQVKATGATTVAPPAVRREPSAAAGSAAPVPATEVTRPRDVRPKAGGIDYVPPAFDDSSASYTDVVTGRARPSFPSLQPVAAGGMTPLGPRRTVSMESIFGDVLDVPVRPRTPQTPRVPPGLPVPEAPTTSRAGLSDQCPNEWSNTGRQLRPFQPLSTDSWRGGERWDDRRMKTVVVPLPISAAQRMRQNLREIDDAIASGAIAGLLGPVRELAPLCHTERDDFAAYQLQLQRQRSRQQTQTPLAQAMARMDLPEEEEEMSLEHGVD